jgi:hypothetical protein
MDWNQLWENFRSGIGTGLLVAVGLVVLFFLYYGFIASTGKGRIERAKIRAREMIESGEIPDERTFNYVYYMLQRVPHDAEAIELLKWLQQLKSKGNTANPT